MRLSSLLMPALAAMAAAQSTTVVSIFEAVADNPYLSYSTYTSLGGSIVGADAHATTYKIGCMSGAPKSVCSIDTPYEVIAGPTTLSYARTMPVEVYGVTVSVGQDVACSFTRTSESAVCTVTADVKSGHISTAITSTQSFETDEIFYSPVTVTEGLSRLNAPQATGTSEGAAGAHRPLITAAPLGAAAALGAAAVLF
ncbi:hypothetical protein HFD88_006217 [Aspergillus terreus]|nr:hypothetical protein HFD88_006217 [Aspergillus terreus]